jgi:hypothetical protein
MAFPLEGDRRVFHARRLNLPRRRGREPGKPHLVDVRPDPGRGAAHRFA